MSCFIMNPEPLAGHLPPKDTERIISGEAHRLAERLKREEAK